MRSTQSTNLMPSTPKPSMPLMVNDLSIAIKREQGIYSPIKNHAVPRHRTPISRCTLAPEAKPSTVHHHSVSIFPLPNLAHHALRPLPSKAMGSSVVLPSSVSIGGAAKFEGATGALGEDGRGGLTWRSASTHQLYVFITLAPLTRRKSEKNLPNSRILCLNI